MHQERNWTRGIKARYTPPLKKEITKEVMKRKKGGGRVSPAKKKLNPRQRELSSFQEVKKRSEETPRGECNLGEKKGVTFGVPVVVGGEFLTKRNPKG